jgi:hypothetical protein
MGPVQRRVLLALRLLEQRGVKRADIAMLSQATGDPPSSVWAAISGMTMNARPATRRWVFPQFWGSQTYWSISRAGRAAIAEAAPGPLGLLAVGPLPRGRSIATGRPRSIATGSVHCHEAP